MKKNDATIERKIFKTENNQLPWLQILQFDSQSSVDLLEPSGLTSQSQDQNQA